MILIGVAAIGIDVMNFLRRYSGGPGRFGLDPSDEEIICDLMQVPETYAWTFNSLSSLLWLRHHNRTASCAMVENLSTNKISPFLWYIRVKRKCSGDGRPRQIFGLNPST